ncbi:MAG: MFS transporter [Phycisphaerales bacterium]|nr:MFS transporter [Phycisphaerales bacterium]
MSQPASVTPATPSPDGVMGFFHSFLDLFRLPRAFWIVIAIFVVESMAYFMALTLMNSYLTRDLGVPDRWASWFVSMFTMLVTLFMLGAGSFAESFGLRKALVGAMILCVLGRVLYAYVTALAPAGLGAAGGARAAAAAPDTGLFSMGGPALLALVFALGVIALGEAILQPVCYSGVKQYTDEKTSSMGYGLIYALMNGGIVVGGAISSYVRPGVQSILDSAAPAAAEAATGALSDAAKAATEIATTVAAEAATTAAGAAEPARGLIVEWFDAAVAALQPLRDALDPALHWLAGWTGSGIQAVNWLCVATAILALLMCFLLTRRTEANKLRPDRIREMRQADTRPTGDRLWSYLADGPFSNVRFMFFIFMLLPVRTLFAHQWLTLPEYVLRAYPKEVSDYMEVVVNWVNAGIILVGVPIATALTRKVHVYTMMIIGSLVSAAPTFLLCSGPNLSLLITYLVVFSVGEALWSARFLEYASELAPEGRIAQYMGLANVPWLLAKGTTGFYSGFLLEAFCPKDGPRHTGALWFIYGCIAMMSPIGLIVARRWVMAGSMHKAAAAPT